VGCLDVKYVFKIKEKKPILKKYGVDNIFKRTDIIRNSMINKHGVPNPGLLNDHVDKIKKTNLEKYGTIWVAQTEEAKAARRETNLKKYGYEVPTKNKLISAKIIQTKIANGGFTKSNSSMEATNFIKSYIHNKKYDNDQCAYANEELGLHEWGIYKNGRWVLFDLVVFQKGYRGDKDKIIEILEYHGPFHYTLEEANEFGDKKAFPWKTNKTTIKESYLRDLEKEKIAQSLTNNYTVIRTRHGNIKIS
jgi:hypothetical protein